MDNSDIIKIANSLDADKKDMEKYSGGTILCSGVSLYPRTVVSIEELADTIISERHPVIGVALRIANKLKV